MSSLATLLSLINEMENVSNLAAAPSIYGGDFGLGIQPHYIRARTSHPSIHLPLDVVLAAERLGNRGPSKKNEKSKVSNIGKDGFQVCMDVQQFKPSELSVKVIQDSIVIEGKHEEREDNHGFITRHFIRRYNIPKDYDSEKLISTLSSDGILTVSIPKPKIEDKSTERVIHIQQTGPAHLNVKENASDGAEKTDGAPATAAENEA